MPLRELCLALFDLLRVVFWIINGKPSGLPLKNGRIVCQAVYELTIFGTNNRAGNTMNKKLAIAGIQGSGKGTQAAKLVEKLDLEFIGVGDLLRWNVENETEHGKVAKEAMSQGKLVSDETVKGILSAKLSSLNPEKGFLLDGFPRNEAQRAWLLENYQIDGCVYLHIEDEEQVVQRMLARKKCPECSMEHNLINVPTDNKCNGCGAELVQRADDNETAIRQRLSAYHAETKPVLKWFEENGSLYQVDATGEIEEIFTRILSAIGV